MTDRMKPYHLTDKKSQMVRFLHLQRKIVLQNQRGVGLIFKGDSEFNFSALHYTAHDLSDTPMAHLLKPRKETIVHIDYRQTGIGSNSCGPRLAEKYAFNEKEIHFAFSMKPIWTESIPANLERRFKPSL